MKHWIAIALTALACSGAEDGDAPDLGTARQPYTFKVSSPGNRTWGVKLTTKGRPSCTKTGTTQQCFFTSPIGAGQGVTMTYKVCVNPLNWPVGDGQLFFFTETSQTLDTWVTNMISSTNNSSVPWSFQHVVPPNGGADCIASGANIIINYFSISGQTLTAEVGQYARNDFVGTCTELFEGAPVDGTYSTCSGSRVFFSPDQLQLYTLQNGYTAFQQKTKRQEALMHALNTAIGIGAQTSNSSVISWPNIEKPSKSFLSTEESCRLKGLSGSGGIDGAFVAISNQTCS